METAILEKIKNPIVYKGGASCATYKMLNEEDIELARLSSRNSEPVRVALIELLTETLKSIAPGRYHMISHVTAALELKDRCLCDLALSAIRDGAHQGDIGSVKCGYHWEIYAFIFEHLFCHITSIGVRNGIMNMQ